MGKTSYVGFVGGRGSRGDVFYGYEGDSPPFITRTELLYIGDSAQDALMEITKQNYGQKHERWMKWWKENIYEFLEE